MTYDDRPEKAEHRETEITLSNTTLLLIFLGVAIICGVFFGFGYTIGKRNTAPAVATVTPKAAEVAEVGPPTVAPLVTTSAPAETAAESDAAMSAKPSAAAAPHETPAATPVPATTAPVAKAAPASTPAPVAKTAPSPVVKTTPPPAPAAAPVAAKVVPPVTHPVVTPKPVPAKTKPPVAAVNAAPMSAPPAVPSRTYVVQVAAVSHQGDADVLVGALRRKGYAVNSYPGTQDSLIHVQVGPFASQKDALAMRDKLSDDGYLAIVK